MHFWRLRAPNTTQNVLTTVYIVHFERPWGHLRFRILSFRSFQSLVKNRRGRFFWNLDRDHLRNFQVKTRPVTQLDRQTDTTTTKPRRKISCPWMCVFPIPYKRVYIRNLIVGRVIYFLRPWRCPNPEQFRCQRAHFLSKESFISITVLNFSLHNLMSNT